MSASSSGSMKEVDVASLGLDKSSNTPVVILREKEGNRVLPIWIGPGEASAIAMKLAGIQFSRPLTHDLFSTVVEGLESELVRVVITKVEDNTYYASLILRRGEEFISIDARPSDSIALALRSEASIYAEEKLLEITNLEIEEAEFEPEDPEEEFLKSSEPTSSSSESGPTEEEKVEELREYLKGLNPEDFGRFTP